MDRLRQDIPERERRYCSGVLAVGRRPWCEGAAVTLGVEGRGLLLGALDRVRVRAAVGVLPCREGPAAGHAAEGGGIQLRREQLLQELHPRLVERRSLGTGGCLRDVTPEATHELAERVDRPTAQRHVTDA